MDTSGFYKKEDDSEMILHGHNYVISGSYNLYRDQKDTYTYPVGGWYWFDSTEEAYAFWNIPMPETNPHYPIQNTPQEQES
jgi:hypothetical protein